MSQHVVSGDATGDALDATADGAFHWDAFVSYNREADSRLARALRRALRRIAVPWYRRSLTRVFLDQTSLAANPDAWGTVERILDATKTFVLLASARAANSQWVEREVAYWRSGEPPRALMVGLTDGTLTWNATTRTFESAALPPSAKQAFTAAPLWVDLTWARHAPRWKLTLWNPLFRDNVASLAAAIRDVDKEILLDEDGRRRRRGLAAALAISAGAVALSVALIVTLEGKSFEQRVAASRQLARDSTAALSDQMDLALLLAVHANRTSGTVEARDALVDALLASRHLRSFLHVANGAEIASVAIDGAGEAIALGRRDGSVEFWDVASARRRRIAPPPSGATVAHVTFAGEALVAGWANGTVAAWEPLRGWRQLVDEDAVVETLATSHDGRATAVGFNNGDVVILASGGRAAPKTFEVATDPVRALAFDPGGNRLAVGTHHGALAVLSLAGDTRETIRVRPPNPAASIVSLAFDERGRRLAIGRDDGLAYIWDVRRTGFKRLGPARGDSVTGLAFRRNDRGLITAGANGEILLWNLHRSAGPQPREVGRARSVTALAVAPTGDLVVTGDGARAAVWDLQGPAPLERRLAHVDGVVRALAFDSSSNTVAVATPGGGIRLLDAGTGRIRQRVPGTQRDVLGLAFAAGGERLVSVASDGSVLDWRLEDEPPSPTVLLRAGDSEAAAVGPGGRSLAYLDATGSLLVGGRSGRGTVVAKVDPLDALSLAVDANGKSVAVGGTAIVLHRGGGRQRLSFPKAADGRPADVVTSLAFRNDGSVLAAGNADHELALWDLKNVGRPFASHVTLSDAITALTFSSDGSQLAAGTSDGAITLWRTDPASWEETACRIANRELNREERARYLRSAAESSRGCGRSS